MVSQFSRASSSYEAENYAWQATSSIVTVAGAGQVAEWCCGVHTAHLLPPRPLSLLFLPLTAPPAPPLPLLSLEYTNHSLYKAMQIVNSCS